MAETSRNQSEQLLADAQRVFDTHKPHMWCCYADRGPCVYEDDREAANRLCGVPSCRVCARGPYDVPAPRWPCEPMRLACAVLGVAVPDAA